MKKIITIFALLLSFQAHSQGWTPLQGFTSSELNSVCVYDNSIIYIGGSSYSLFKSIDEGDSWNQLSNTIVSHVRDFDFPSQNVGYVVGSTGSTGHGIKTSDGGITWDSLNITSNSSLRKVQFLDTLNGYVLSHKGIVYKTNNGGNTWTQSSLPFIGSLFCDMYFFNIDTGLVLDSTVIYQTTDGGQNWNSGNVGGTGRYFSFSFIDSTGYIAGRDYPNSNYALFKKTTDYGLTWNPLPASTVSSNCSEIYFHDDLFGHLIGPVNHIFSTFDGGQTWNDEYLPNAASHAIDFYDCLGFIAGYSGNTHKTVSCGLSTEVDAGNDIYLTCNESAQINPTISNAGIVSFTYSWSPSYGLSDTTILSPIANPIITTTYNITVFDGYFEVVDTITIFVDPLPGQEICMVTVDSVYGKNMIVWEKAELPIESFYIWKESIIAGTYNVMDIVPYDSAGIYMDMTSDPITKSDRYSISILDSCGFISDNGPAHKPIHLNVSLAVPMGYSLTWEHYEGFNYNTYVIYRGSSPGVLDSIAAVSYSPGVFTYTDLTPQTPLAYYMIAAIKADTCFVDTGTKSTTSYNKTISNIVDVSDYSIEDARKLNNFMITPNPFSEQISLVFEKDSEYQIRILDILGKQVHTTNIVGSRHTISTSDLLAGTYLLLVRSEEGVAQMKMVKN